MIVLGNKLRRMLVKYTIRGQDSIIQEGVWSSTLPARGECFSAAKFKLEGKLLFLGTDSATSNDGIVYVRLLLIQ